MELPRGQARTALGLLCLPEEPVAYTDTAAAFGISLGTVHTHLRRIHRRRPDLNGEIMAERRRQLSARHEAVIAERRRRSLLWVRCRWAAAYGKGPWRLAVGRIPTVLMSCGRARLWRRSAKTIRDHPRRRTTPVCQHVGAAGP
jgi:hypothetical protein